MKRGDKAQWQSLDSRGANNVEARNRATKHGREFCRAEIA